MGLRTSHGDFSMSCTLFSEWRHLLANLAGIPLPLMEGYYVEGNFRTLPDIGVHVFNSEARDALIRLHEHLPLKWRKLKDDALISLLMEDCAGGRIAHFQMDRLITRLSELRDDMPDGGVFSHRDYTTRFIDTLYEALKSGEDLTWA